MGSIMGKAYDVKYAPEKDKGGNIVRDVLAIVWLSASLIWLGVKVYSYVKTVKYLRYRFGKKKNDRDVIIVDAEEL